MDWTNWKVLLVTNNEEILNNYKDRVINNQIWQILLENDEILKLFAQNIKNYILNQFNNDSIAALFNDLQFVKKLVVALLEGKDFYIEKIQLPKENLWKLKEFFSFDKLLMLFGEKFVQAIALAIKSLGFEEIVFIGNFSKTNTYSVNIGKLSTEDNLLNHLINIFEEIGIKVIGYLEEFKKHGWVISEKSKLSQHLQKIVEFSQKILQLDLGQTTIFLNNTPIAVEVIEGTDLAIERALQLTNPYIEENNDFSFIVVKLPRPNQDLRIDVPVVGEKTLEIISKSKAKSKILILASNKCLIDGGNATLEKAKKLGIEIYGV